MKIQPIKQWDEDACGPTCIEMTLRYFEVPHTREEISSVTDYQKEEGLSNRQLVKALEQLSLSTETYTGVTWDQLHDLNTENTVIILSWMLDGYIGHFSVLERIEEEDIYLAEPVTGAMEKIEKIKFMRQWWDFEAQDNDIWYPETTNDIQLRWMVTVKK